MIIILKTDKYKKGIKRKKTIDQYFLWIEISKSSKKKNTSKPKPATYTKEHTMTVWGNPESQGWSYTWKPSNAICTIRRTKSKTHADI